MSRGIYDTCTHVCFTRHYKDTIQDKLMILVSFCSKFTGVQVCRKKLSNRA